MMCSSHDDVLVAMQLMCAVYGQLSNMNLYMAVLYIVMGDVEMIS